MIGTHDENGDLFGDDLPLDIDDILNRLDDLADDPRAWPKTLTDFIEVSASVLIRRNGLNVETAQKYTRELIVALAHYMGGRQVYLPRDDRLLNAIRDNYIYREFMGNNHQDLADKHNLTRQQIYNIIAYQSKLHRKRVQPGLFDTTD